MVASAGTVTSLETTKKKHVRKSHWEFYCLVLLEAQRLQIFYFLLLLTRFHVSVPLFSDRSQMMSTCGKNKEEAHEPQVSVPLVFLLNILWFLHFSYLKTAPAKVFSRLSLA